MRHQRHSPEPRVVHLVLTLDVGGAEVLVSRLAKSLKELGFRSQVICLDAEGSLAPSLRRHGVPVACLHRRPGILDLSCVWRLSQLLRVSEANLVHTHNIEAYTYGAIAARLVGGVPVVHTQHGLPNPFGWKQRCKVLPLRHTVRWFVGVSDEVTAVGLQAGWFAPDRTVTITNGVDTETFRPDLLARQRTRRALGIADDDLVVICVARLAEIKDHTTLLRGFAASAISKDAHLLLVGDGPERERIKVEVQRLGLAEQIRLLGSRSDVRDLLAGADVFALTSRSEGISMSLLEAMAMGLAPVVTAVGGNTQLVNTGQPGATGILIPPGAIKKLASALCRLGKTHALRTRLGAAARAAVVERFSDRVMRDRYLATYRS